MTKVGLYLMGYKGLGCLQVAIDKKKSLFIEIAFVVSAQDKSVLNDYFLDIKKLAQDHQIPFYNRSTNTKVANTDISIGISWRWIIKDPDNLIVFHDSLLPKYRGFNPLVTALIEGDKYIGVTAIKANKDFDKGNIVGYKKTSIEYPIKIDAAIHLITILYEYLLVEIMKKISKRTLREIVQNENIASYSLWRDDEDYKIEWNDSSTKIKRMIDAVGFPYKGAKTIYDGKTIKIIDAEIVDDLKIINRTSGKILFINNNEPIVVCGSGLLIIKMATDISTEEIIEFKKLRVRLY